MTLAESLLADSKADLEAAGYLVIKRPHVPFGPQNLPETRADANYFDEAARHIRDGFAVGGYNLTMTVINLLHDVATELRGIDEGDWQRHGSEAQAEDEQGLRG